MVSESYLLRGRGGGGGGEGKVIFGEKEKNTEGKKNHASPPAALLEGISCVYALRVPQADLVIMSTWMWRACVRARFGPVLDSYAA